MKDNSIYIPSKTNISAIRKAARKARSPRPNTPSPIAFLVKKPGSKEHPVHEAWDAAMLDPSCAYKLAYECFLAFISVDNIYDVVSRIIGYSQELDEIISRAAADTWIIRHSAMSVRRGRSYLRHPERERILKLLAERYPASVSIAELCAVYGAERLTKNFLGRYPAWFARTSRGQYRLVDADILDAVQQRLLDARRAALVQEYIEESVKCYALDGLMDNDEFSRLVNHEALAGSVLKDAHDAGVLYRVVWDEFETLARAEEDVFETWDIREPQKIAVVSNDAEPDIFDTWGVVPEPDPVDEFAALVDDFEFPQPPSRPEPIHLKLEPKPEPVSVDSFWGQFQSGTRIKAREMYDLYVAWCRDQKIESVSLTRFGSMVRTAGFAVKRAKNDRWYQRVSG